MQNYFRISLLINFLSTIVVQTPDWKYFTHITVRENIDKHNFLNIYGNAIY